MESSSRMETTQQRSGLQLCALPIEERVSSGQGGMNWDGQILAFESKLTLEVCRTPSPVIFVRHLCLIRADITSRWYQQLRCIEHGSVPMRQESLNTCTSLGSVSLYGNISDFGVLETKHASERAVFTGSHDILPSQDLQVDSSAINLPHANGPA